MVDNPLKTEQEFPELAALVTASFPEIKCLRCKNENFYLEPAFERKLRWYSQSRMFGPNLPEDAKTPIISIICTRCGHVEQHFRSVLEAAAKPILED